MSENESLKRIKDKKKKRKKSKIILISVLGVLAILIAVGVLYYNHIKNRVFIETKPKESATQKVDYEEVEGITNVLLIGTDGRTSDEAARADSIIIATLDNNNKKVKLTSIIRDTLVNIPEYGEDKINAAFFYGSSELDDDGKLRGFEGGASLLMDTIEENFDLHLDKYVIVNFWGFEEIIDEVGGIEADIKDYEIDEINKYIGESTGVNSPPITETGLQTLNGQQALSYARIRYVGNGGFERSERQSKVLFQLATKLKEVNPLKYISIADTLSKQVKTNIPIPEALDLAYTIYKLPTLEFEQLQIPQAELIARDNLYKDRGWCLLIDIKQNAQIMHDFIFNNKLPNVDEFDLNSVYSVAAAYDAEEARYNSIYNINPADYDDKGTDETTNPTPPKVEKPSNENQEKPNNNTGGNNNGENNTGGNNNGGNNNGGNNETPPTNPGGSTGEDKGEEKPPATGGETGGETGGNNETKPTNPDNKPTAPSNNTTNQ
ncbi:LCP family protein [Clostridium sp. AL.422]|uniref:LCP family protein n=1 Tax=Clostridium TaxID=1485 RepID=UPI00293DAB99|nr:MULTISPECIES: LCP family protein [unclassified Clostridium]MDV4150477.1 LCP family protein [Clostridium sp. AL.422]